MIKQKTKYQLIHFTRKILYIRIQIEKNLRYQYTNEIHLPVDKKGN